MRSETNTRLTPFGCHLRLNHADELDTLDVRALVNAHRVLLIRGLPPLPNDVFLALITRLAGGLSALLKWDFGYVMEVKEDPSKANYLFSRESVPLHWDGAFHVSPSILAFQCVEAAGEGGETVFCDTTRVYQDASPEERAEWARLRLSLTTEKKAHYGGEKVLDLIARHPTTAEPIMRFAERVETTLNPVDVRIAGATSRDWLRVLPERLYAPHACYEHAWQVGDILFADNHALLHGRRAYGEGTARCLQRIQIL